MYQYHNNKLSIPAKVLYEDWKVVAYRTYLSYCQRGKFIRTNEGKGKGNEAYVSFYDLDTAYQQRAIQEFGNPKDVVVRNELEKYIITDPKAITFFAQHRKPNGKRLSIELQREKATNAMILNAIETIINDQVKCNKAFGKKKTRIWKNISDAVNGLNPKKWQYDLPSNDRSLRRKYNRYIDNRYMSLIHAGEGSQNARVVTEKLEKLIIALYCLPNKPYATTVHDLYLQFLGGAIEVFDIETGELFNREDFYENGIALEVSESTIWNYINKPKNQLIIKKYRNGAYDFNHKVRPHVNRHAPVYSMSKITLDDRDIMHTKLHDGSKVMAYYAFDDMSTAMIGIAHSKSKDAQLYLDCIRSMFQFTTSKGLGVPMQMEVENHLVSDFKDGLMKAQNVFPFVRWCNPTNSQEKYAERLIGEKKYGVEKMNNQNVGRHYARKDSNRVTRQKIFDAQNDNYKFAKATYKEIVANELQEQIEYNNQLHPNQQKFKGMTRLEVFLANVNPNLPKLDKSLLAQYIGLHTQTSIRRSQYVTVQYGKYQLPTPQILEQLAPNNYKVDAYYFKENNEVSEVYLYQNGVYICTCEPVPVFNRANAEWTDTDKENYQKAMKYIGEFDKMVKTDTAEKLQRVEIIKNPQTPTIDVDCEVVEETVLIDDYDFSTDTSENEINRALNDL